MSSKELPMLDVSTAVRNRSAFSAKIWHALGWPARVVEARRTLAQLAQMSDRELSDLGLLRADLADCTALPLDDDPGERLARARAVRAWYGRAHHDEAA
jgi:uncharacterized protein YjiS (DUF1127 family)